MTKKQMGKKQQKNNNKILSAVCKKNKSEQMTEWKQKKCKMSNEEETKLLDASMYSRIFSVFYFPL